jgi:hypothetical protein
LTQDWISLQTKKPQLSQAIYNAGYGADGI